MKISTKCRYGIRAVLEIARNYGDTPTRRKDISKNQGIPSPYLENILITLKNNGIVASVRGSSGGFVLKKRPEDIHLLGIFEALEGSLNLLDCIDMPELCDRHEDCLIRPVWIEVQDAQKKVLRRTSIKDLLEREQKGESFDFLNTTDQ